MPTRRQRTIAGGFFDFPYDASDARRQFKVGCVWIDSEKITAKLVSDVLFPGTLVSLVSARVAVLVDLDCKLLDGQIQIDFVVGDALLEFERYHCLSQHALDELNNLFLSFLRYRVSSLIPSSLATSAIPGNWLLATGRLRPDSVM